MSEDEFVVGGLYHVKSPATKHNLPFEALVKIASQEEKEREEVFKEMSDDYVVGIVLAEQDKSIGGEPMHRNPDACVCACLSYYLRDPRTTFRRVEIEDVPMFMCFDEVRPQYREVLESL